MHTVACISHARSMYVCSSDLLFCTENETAFNLKKNLYHNGYLRTHLFFSCFWSRAQLARFAQVDSGQAVGDARGPPRACRRSRIRAQGTDTRKLSAIHLKRQKTKTLLSIYIPYVASLLREALMPPPTLRTPPTFYVSGRNELKVEWHKFAYAEWSSRFKITAPYDSF